MSGCNTRTNGEKRFDMLLHDYNYPHTYEPDVPNSNYKADFMVWDVYVEIWDRTEEEYLERKKEKREHYERMGLSNKLVEIELQDIESANKLSKKLQEVIRKKTVNQQTVEKVELPDTTVEPTKIDAWDVAETIAKDKGELTDVENKMERVEAERKRLEKKLDETATEMNKLKRERQDIVRQYL